jgi:hypothetical protein
MRFKTNHSYEGQEIQVFWDLTLCKLVNIYGCSQGAMCFHLQCQAVQEDALSQYETTIQTGLILHHGYIPEKSHTN